MQQIQTVETNTFSMDYLRFGSGPNTLVIIPGLSVQSVLLLADAVVAAYKPLANDFTIYLFDRRKNLPNPYPVRDIARDTQEAIRALGISRASLFGASLGGMIAQVIAIEQPDLVQKLVLGSTTPCVTEQSRKVIGQWIALAQQGDVETLYLKFGEYIYAPSTFEQVRSQLVAAARFVTGDDLSRFITLAQSAQGFDVRDELEKIACPVLVLGASDDAVLGGDSSLQFAERLGGRSNFEMHLYEGFGHAAYDFAPDYKERMRRFLL